MNKARDLLIAIFFGLLSLAICAASFAYGDKFNAILSNLITASAQLPVILSKIDKLADKVAIVADKQDRFIQDQQQRFNDPKTQEAIGLLLRLGRPLTRVIDRADDATAQVQRLVKNLADENVPNIEKATVKAVGQVERLAANGADTLDTTNRTMGRLYGLASDQRIYDTLDHTAKASANLESISATTAQKLPLFFDNTNATMGNVAGITGKIDTAAGKFFKPMTLKEKIWSAAGGFAVKQAPFIITTVFKR